jgi:hypothetical protein
LIDFLNSISADGGMGNEAI